MVARMYVDRNVSNLNGRSLLSQHVRPSLLSQNRAVHSTVAAVTSPTHSTPPHIPHSHEDVNVTARHYTELNDTPSMSERPTSSRRMLGRSAMRSWTDLWMRCPEPVCCHAQSTPVCANDDHISRESKGCETAGRAQLDQTSIPMSLYRKVDLYFSYGGTVLKSRWTCVYV